MVKIIPTILILTGISFFGYSLSLEPYIDQEEYEIQYSAMGKESSEQFHKLREKYLTPKYRLADLGSAITVLGFLLVPLVFLPNKLRSPKQKWVIILAAFLAVILTAIAEIFILFQDFHRGEFPWWADSLGIPLTGITLITIILTVWAGLHLFFMKGNFSLAVPLAKVMSRDINLWLAFVVYATVIVILLYTWEGSALHIFAGAVWLYFYTSLAAGRSSAFNKSLQRTARAARR